MGALHRDRAMADTAVTRRARHQLLAVVGLVGALVLGWRLVRPLITRVLSARAALADEQARLARSRGLVGNIDSLRGTHDSALRTLAGLTPLLFTGPTGAEGRAELSVFLDALARVHEVRLLSLRPLPDSSLHGLVGVGIEVDAETDITGLARFLAGLERDPRTVVVTSLAVRAAEDGTEAARWERLEVRLTLWGWLLSGRERS